MTFVNERNFFFYFNSRKRVQGGITYELQRRTTLTIPDTHRAAATFEKKKKKITIESEKGINDCSTITRSKNHKYNNLNQKKLQETHMYI